MQIFKPGSTIRIHQTEPPIRATVCEVSLAIGGTIQYRVAWWDAGIRNIEWVYSHEVCADEKSEYQKIGFHRNGVSEP